MHTFLPQKGGIFIKTYQFTVTNQCIETPKCAAFVSGSAEIYEAVFVFDASWDGFARTAVFECEGERREQLLVGDRCVVPWEILHAGAYLRVGVYGVSGDATMPTVYSGTIFVARGAEPSEAAREHSADMFDQIVEIGQQAAEAKEQWENMSAEAQTLPAGTPATASYSGGVLSLGIPAGAGGEGGASRWEDLSDKPFERLGDNLKVVGGALTVDTASNVEKDNTKPITSAAVYTEVGNINVLLALI